MTKFRNRQYVAEYLAEHHCVDCGEGDPVKLQFDHRDPAAKEILVSTLIKGGYSMKRLKAEISKCDVRCANCHSLKTAKEQRWYLYERHHLGKSDEVLLKEYLVRHNKVDPNQLEMFVEGTVS